ncbi:MAG: hypothetical protein PHR39_03070, partial [Actinomycetota bacterium]|nr:hypothetical protein [Actinomycetota bacterium]
LTNISRNKRYEVNISMSGDGDIEIWDLFSGDKARIKNSDDADRKQFFRAFDPVSSCLIVQHKLKFVDEEIKMKNERPAYLAKGIKEEINLKGRWKLKKSDSNVVLLDYCDLNIGKRSILNDAQICQAEEEIQNNRWDDFNLIFKFNIKNKNILKNNVYLAIDEFKWETIKINEENLCILKSPDYFLDQKIKKYEIGQHLKVGMNKIEISGFWYPDIELNPLYLLGDFLVFFNKNYDCFELKEIKPTIEKKPLVDIGFPFYCGRLSFVKDFDIVLSNSEKIYISCGNIISSISSLYLNDRLVGKFYSKNYKQDISNFAGNGKNKLEIEICTSLFNIFGPIHYKDGELYEVNPESFCPNDKQTRIYNFKNYGLIGDVKLLISLGN